MNNTVTHLAANSIAQIDALADIVWIAQGRPGEVSAFRNRLGLKEPAIAIIRDACDSHKHGNLRRKDHISGERPAAVTRAGFFLDHSFIGGPPTRYLALVIRKVDGTEQDVSDILSDAMHAWRREFSRLGYGANWLIFGQQH
ncbi:hypothetical protein [Lichenibacterium ramalinae]|uniref:hypothetical protein n=1 Tax=Lichenibacterium ramalinae TaxID=2316527 RepID=UPI00100EAFE7|nr:hypothetical protein [Lichenibacterium ramalinae]